MAIYRGPGICAVIMAADIGYQILLTPSGANTEVISCFSSRKDAENYLLKKYRLCVSE